MALVTKIIMDERKVSWTTETVCSIRVQNRSGENYFQLNSYGSYDRKIFGQSSQALTFDRARAIQLRDILCTLYPFESSEI